MFDFSVKRELVITVPSGSFIFRGCELADESNEDGTYNLRIDYDQVGIDEHDLKHKEVGDVILHLIETHIEALNFGNNDIKTTDRE